MLLDQLFIFKRDYWILPFLFLYTAPQHLDHQWALIRRPSVLLKHRYSYFFVRQPPLTVTLVSRMPQMRPCSASAPFISILSLQLQWISLETNYVVAHLIWYPGHSAFPFIYLPHLKLKLLRQSMWIHRNLRAILDAVLHHLCCLLSLVVVFKGWKLVFIGPLTHQLLPARPLFLTHFNHFWSAHLLVIIYYLFAARWIFYLSWYWWWNPRWYCQLAFSERHLLTDHFCTRVQICDFFLIGQAAAINSVVWWLQVSKCLLLTRQHRLERIIEWVLWRLHNCVLHWLYDVT